MKEKLDTKELEKLGFKLDFDGCYELNNISIVPDFRLSKNVFLKTSESNGLWFEVDMKIRFVYELKKLMKLFNNKT